MGRKVIILEKGQVFGKLTVIKFDHIKEYITYRGKINHYYYKCRCECGNIKIAQKNSLINGATKSCGCLVGRKVKLKDNIPHNLRNTRIHRIWYVMKYRCDNKNYTSYKDYGGRGIKVCNEWKNFKNGFINFHDWAMENGYKEDLSIDRINVNGNYEPSNCRWATDKQQGRNKRSRRDITYKGETKCVSEWAEITGINYSVVLRRLQYGWSVEKALTTPVINRKKVSKK